MSNLLSQHCALQSSLLKRFSKSNFFKHFYLRHFTMALLFWFGGDTGCDFMNIDKNNSTSAATFHTSLVTMKRSGLNTSSLTSLTDYFRSRQSGNWSTLSTWESSPDNINWQLATEVPSKDANTITVQTGHKVSVTNSVTLDQTVIAGVLELQTVGILNINDGAGDDVTILGNGVLQITSINSYTTSIMQNSGANIHIATNGKIQIGNGGSVGAGYENFVTSLVNVWDDGAVYEFNSSATFIIAGPLSDLIYFPNAGNKIPIFRISKVGGVVNNGSGKSFYLNGLLELNTDVSFSGAGKKYFRNGIRGNATISQTGSGKFYLSNPNDPINSNAILDGTSLKMILSAVMDLSPNKTIIPIEANVTVSGANLNNSFVSNVFTINGTLDVADKGINNTKGAVIINGTFRTANTGGFSGGGSSIISGGITLNSGSTIELYALGDQSLNTRTDFKNLVFSGSGIKTPVGSFNPAGTITIKDNAIFDCSGRNIGDETFGLPTSTNLTMAGNSRLIVSTFGPNPKMGGVYNLTGGVIEFKGSGGTPQTIRSKNYQNIEITGNNVLMSEGNITLNDLGTFTIKKDGIFTINDNTINGPLGTQTVTVESGGLFKCGAVKGFHGFTLTPAPIKSSAINSDIENIILAPNSTVEYSRSSPPLSDGDQPITTVNGLIYQNLILSGTGNKTAPPDDLIIQGNLSKTGSCNFIHNNGTVIFNGSNVQTYLSSSPQMIFYNLVNENVTGLSINDNLSVYKKLLLRDNSKLNLNADIILLSDKNQTANIGQIPANGIINYGTGRFIAERYINTNTINGGHLKSWQFIATPAFGETIHDTWQEKGNTTIPGYGTWITDPSGTSNGFDAISVSPSLKYYNASSDNWTGISNTNMNLENEKGYMIFVRGDRQASNFNSPATPTILRTRGKLYSPAPGYNPPASIVDAGKFQSIGNPYASVIDFTKVNISPEIENSFHVWDPTLGGIYGLGGYQTISATTNFRAIPGGTSIYNSSDDYRNIQSGQAFFVYNYSSAPGTVGFSENCKTDFGNHLVNRDPPGLLNEKQFLFTSLYSGNNKLVDGNAIVFGNQFSNKIDKDDALKLSNSGENIGIKRDGKILIVEARQSLQNTDTIFFNLSNLTKQKYRFMFIPQNMPLGFEAFLFDHFLKTETSVNLSDTTIADFMVTDDLSSSAANRFMIVLKELEISFISVNAFQKNENILLEWKVENENNVKYYEIEHSIDGIHFSVKEQIAADNNFKGNYLFEDNNPAAGMNYYRISGLNSDGKKTYSRTAEVFFEIIKSEISVYPNPLSGEKISLQFIHQPAGKYLIRLLNSSGQMILSEAFNHPGGTYTKLMKVNANAAHGIYQLEIIKPDGKKNTIRIKK